MTTTPLLRWRSPSPQRTSSTVAHLLRGPHETVSTCGIALQRWHPDDGLSAAWCLPCRDQTRLWILVTGSRKWPRQLLPAVRSTLVDLLAETGLRPGQVIVVHGGQGTRERGVVIKGLDLLAAEAAQELGMNTEVYPADWANCLPTCRHPRRIGPFGPYCPSAGYRRNIKMVQQVAAYWPRVCLAWPVDRSPGTRHCMDCANKAGIEVRLGAQEVR
jgi:hypothetical protein